MKYFPEIFFSNFIKNLFYKQLLCIRMNICFVCCTKLFDKVDPNCMQVFFFFFFSQKIQQAFIFNKNIYIFPFLVLFC